MFDYFFPNINLKEEADATSKILKVKNIKMKLTKETLINGTILGGAVLCRTRMEHAVPKDGIL